jgi:hypothetical protein
MRQVALQNLPKTRASAGGSRLAFAPRAFLQIFITTTLTYRLETWLAFRFARRLHATFRWCKHLRSGQNSGRPTLRSEHHTYEILLYPNCVLTGADKRAKMSTLLPKRVPSTVFARVSDGSVSTANWSKGAETVLYRYCAPRVFCGSLQATCPIARPRLTALHKH